MNAKIHIVGIGGVGMSALAQALLDAGRQVSGSDRLLDSGDETETLSVLRKQGVALFPQNGSGVDSSTSHIVVSTAIEEDNPDLLAAKRFGLPIVHRAKELANLLSGKKLCAVTGTCGKSTVTAMLGHLLASCGFNPTVVNGAAVVGWDNSNTRIGSARHGDGEWAIIEADESDKSLMVFQPDATIITNASADHFGRDVAEKLFDAFAAKTTGPVVDGRTPFSQLWPQDLPFSVPVPGEHNLLNAKLALEMALRLGASPSQLCDAMATFPGVKRRMEKTGSCNGALVIDDYAHNPEKISACWTTLADISPEGVTGLWRPHGYGPLRKMMDDLVLAFQNIIRPQDKLIVLPVYDAGGTADRSVNGDELVRRLSALGKDVSFVEEYNAAEPIMLSRARSGATLLVFGARDPDLPRFARKIAENN